MSRFNIENKIELIVKKRLEELDQSPPKESAIEEDELDFLAHGVLEEDQELYPQTVGAGESIKDLEKRLRDVHNHAMETEEAVMQILAKFKSKNPKIMELLKKAQTHLKDHTTFTEF